MKEHIEGTILVIDPDLVRVSGTVLSGLGRGHYALYKAPESPESYIETLEESFAKYWNEPTVENETEYSGILRKTERLGELKVSSGSVGVFLEKDVIASDPDFYTRTGAFVYTKFPDWSGDIQDYTDTQGNNHLLGIGSTDFITIEV
jgi:hypothetical protein